MQGWTVHARYMPRRDKRVETRRAPAPPPLRACSRGLLRRTISKSTLTTTSRRLARFASPCLTALSGEYAAAAHCADDILRVATHPVRVNSTVSGIAATGAAAASRERLRTGPLADDGENVTRRLRRS